MRGLLFCTAMSDENGQAVWRATATPFGETTVNEDVNGDGKSVTLNLRTPGQYFDVETGLNYNYYRYYDPRTGRYITADPVGLTAGTNLYAYVNGNPFYFTDRFGLVEVPWYDGGDTFFELGVSSKISERFPQLPDSIAADIAEKVRENMTQEQYDKLDVSGAMTGDKDAEKNAEQTIKDVIDRLGKGNIDPSDKTLIDMYNKLNKNPNADVSEEIKKYKEQKEAREKGQNNGERDNNNQSGERDNQPRDNERKNC